MPISARVLWVDDEESITKMIKKILERLGHKADVANSGKDAIDLLAKNKYDLLITDIEMPGMNGWKLIKTVALQYNEMKIAVVSASVSTFSQKEQDDENVDFMLEKPVLFADIQRLIDTAMQS